MLEKSVIKKALETVIQKRDEELSSLHEYNGFTEEDNNDYEALTKLYKDALDQLNSDDYIAKSDYLRLAADFDNYKKRAVVQQKQVAEGVSRDIIESLLPIVDDMERVLSPIEISNESLIEQGVRLIYNNLIKVLEDEGCKKIDVVQGNKFDPFIHEAITTIAINSENNYKQDQITEVYQSGWMHNGKLLRAAKVAVASDRIEK